MIAGLYISHGRIPEALQAECARSMVHCGLDVIYYVVPSALKIKPFDDYGRAIRVNLECDRPGGADRWNRVLVGLGEMAETRTVAMLEHDCLYPVPYGRQIHKMPPWPEQASYSPAVRLCRDGFAAAGPLTSTLTIRWPDLARIARKRLEDREAGNRIIWDEPGRNPGDELGVVRRPGSPVVDIRHGANFTGDRKGETARQQYWGDFRDLWQRVDPITFEKWGAGAPEQ